MKSKNDVIIIFSVGKHHAQIYADGKIYTEGIRGFDFNKEAGEYPKLSATSGVLPILGDGDRESLECFLKNISDEIQKYILESQNAAATGECDSSTETKGV